MREITTQKELDEAGSSWVKITTGDFWILRENARAVLRENASAELWDFTVPHLLSKEATFKKGPKATVIKPNYPKNIRDWAKLKGLPITKNRIQLYKVLRLDGKDFHSASIDYLEKGKDIVDPKWDASFKDECGAALHLADSPEGAKTFLQGRENYLLISVSADIKDCRCFPGHAQYPMKLRARACRFVKIIEKVEKGKVIA